MKKIIITLWIFMFTFSAGAIGTWLHKGQVTKGDLVPISLFAATFSIMMFFVIRQEWLYAKRDYLQTQTIIRSSPAYRKLKRIYATLGLVVLIATILFISYRPSIIKLRTAEIIVPVALMILIVWYINVLKRFSSGKTVAKVLQQTIKASLKRGIIGGLLLSLAIILGLIVYFLYQLYKR